MKTPVTMSIMFNVTPISRLCVRSICRLGLFLALAFHTSAIAEVVFSGSFESPVVSGFDDNTVPDNGNWIGSTNGYGSSNRGLYNESVIYPATPPFTTPYGDQAYYLNYTNSALTTAQGVVSETLTADETYTVKFNTAVVSGNEASEYTYKVEFLAFDLGDDDSARQDGQAARPGTVLASITGEVNTTDMSQEIAFTFTPDGTDPSLGKELGLRLVKAGGTVLYDNLRLIVGHDFTPNPADGEDLSAGGNVTLSWTDLPPTTPATETPVDILFGTDPGALNLEVDGQVTSTAIVNAPTAGTYFWRIDAYPDGDPNGTPVSSNVFSFTIGDTDGDGLPDDYELANTDPPSATDLDPTSDLDIDGLTAAQEYQFGTDPNVDDTDLDTLLDGEEINGTAGLRPATNPLNADTDGDGLNDGVESNTGTWVSAADTGTNPVDTDYDNDGLNDGAETNTGTLVDRFDTGTDPFDPDTDADGAGDYYEVVAAYTNPHSDQDFPNVPYPLPDPDPTDLGLSSGPVKVYIMAGQSNMVGIGYINSNEPGSLNTITRVDNKFPNLIDASSNFTERNDVIYRGVVTANDNNGPLTINQGGGNDRVGPELGFGHVMGYYHGEPVLLVKASQGNRSLAWDYAPPGSPRFDFDGITYAGYGDTDSSWPVGGSPDEVVNWYCGKEYDQGFLDEADWAPAGADDPPIINAADVLDFNTGTLNNLPTAGNNLNGRTFEIAGFVWWQGHKDGGEDRTGTAGAYATQYEQRLEGLINSLRTEFNAPTAPFVVATIGFGGGGWDAGSSGDTIYNAQLAVSDPFLYPAFENTVASVDTTGYWRDGSESPGGQGFHYMNNAETYTLVGDAMARSMIELVELAESNDTLPPAITTTIPADDAVDVSAGINLEAAFNDNIAIGTGNITLVNITDGSGDIVIDVTDSSQVSVGSSGFTLIINPSVNLSDTKEYAVQFDAGSIVDDASPTPNPFAGISDTTTWSFTTASPDTTAPTLLSLNPANGAQDVLPSTDLEATFSEPITIGTGKITLVDTTNGTDTRVIDVTDGTQISINDDTLIINPTIDLGDETLYAVQIDATAIDDLVGNSYAGISDTTSWTITTPLPGVVFSDDFELPDVDGYNATNTSKQASSDWVKSAEGFGSDRTGVVDGVYEGTWTAPGGEQAYAMRYTNSGVTTANGVIGSLTAGTTISVSFDLFVDGFNGGDTLSAQLVTFNGGVRNDLSGGPLKGTSSYLANSGTLTAPATDSQRVTLIYTVGDDVVDDNGEGTGTATTFDSSVLGHDIAIRFSGRTSAASIDNVLVTITSGGGDTGNDYSSWIAGYDVGGLTAPNDDADGDGVSNAAENYFGTDPSTSSAGLSASGVTLGGNTTFTFSHPISDTPAPDLTAAYQWSTDLATFNGDGVTAGGTTVTFAVGTPADGEVTVTATVTGTDPGKVFVTVDVTQNP